MSLVEVHTRYGTWPLLRLVGALVGFLLLRALRAPLVLLTRLLDAGAVRMDCWATGQAGPDGPSSAASSAAAGAAV